MDGVVLYLPLSFQNALFTIIKLVEISTADLCSYQPHNWCPPPLHVLHVTDLEGPLVIWLSMKRSGKTPVFTIQWASELIQRELSSTPNIAVTAFHCCLLRFVITRTIQILSRKVAGSIPDEMNTFFVNLPNSSSRTMPSMPLTEMSTRNRKIMFVQSRTRPVRKVDNLTIVYELTV
jgi:hypothetical protein